MKTKLAVPAAAKDHYISASFEKQRKYAEACGVPWFILSAKYGFVAPKERIEPHELYLPATSASYRASWGIKTVDRLAELAGALQGITVEIHADRPYLDAVAGPLKSRGADVVGPLAGLRSGQRQQWYIARAHDR